MGVKMSSLRCWGDQFDIKPELAGPCVKVFKLTPTAVIPTKAHETDAGWDLYADEDIFIDKGATVKVSTGIAMTVSPGYILKIEDRSGLALDGFRTGAGILDQGFNGNISVVLHNINAINGKKPGLKFGYKICRGDRIAQIIIIKTENLPLYEVDELWTSVRGSTGFGESGK